MSKCIRAAALLLAALTSYARAESCIWYADDDAIRRMLSDTNEVVASAPLRDPARIVMNAEDCGVWALDRHERRLLRYLPDGSLERSIELRNMDRRLDKAEQLEIDAYDGTLWVSDDRSLFHISPDGRLLERLPAAGEVRRFQVAADQTLWVLGERELWHYDAHGTLLATFPLSRHLRSDARYFALDSLGGTIWLADENELAKLSIAEPEAAPLRLRLSRRIRDLAVDPFSGKAWIAHGDELLGFSRDGALVHEVQLEPLGIKKPELLAFDPAARALWVGSERSVSRFTDAGQFLARFAVREGDEAIGVPAFKILPSLTLVRPPKEALTNNPRPEFSLAYGADCNGQSCGLPSTYFKSYSLSATLNGEEVGAKFQFDADSGEARYTPPTRLPEGLNIFTARVKDGFGHDSDQIRNTFTVDTIPPRFLTLIPADGSIFQTAQVTIQGTTDDPKATVVLNGATQTGAAFAFPVTLAPGANIFALSAVDPAGNTANAVVHLTFVPISIAIETPVDGASIQAGSVLVSGTFQAPANTGITVNGSVAAISGNHFYAQVPLRAGSNLLAVSGTAPEGAMLTRSVTVTASGRGPIELLATPTQGIAPLGVSFSAVSDGMGIAQIEADYDGDGTVDFTLVQPEAVLQHTYAAPGVYQAQIKVTDTQGTVHAFTQAVVATSLASADAMLRGVYGGMLTKLRAGDIDGAVASFTASAREQYRGTFEAIGRANLASVVDRLGSIDGGTISERFAEYVLIRSKPEGPQVYLVYLIRGEDGVWRIDGM